jgi:hypothetical protein
MTRHRYIPSLHDPELERHHAAGLTDFQIGTKMRFSALIISSRRDFLDLPPNAQAKKEPPKPVAPVMPAKPNPIAEAHRWLGKRLRETTDGFRLDGVPANLPSVMKATNRILKAQGIDQIGPDGWRV